MSAEIAIATTTIITVSRTTTRGVIAAPDWLDRRLARVWRGGIGIVVFLVIFARSSTWQQGPGTGPLPIHATWRRAFP
ncbi:MAG: hypothetical protein Q4B10_04470 [Actinomycetaceae bacterium]|nr:hypothetical protein [Actinomycetaceae bacterium]